MKISEIKEKAGKTYGMLIKEILGKLPNDEVLTTSELAKKIGTSIRALVPYGLRFKENSFCCHLRHAAITRVWGKKEAIRKLKKHLKVR